VNLVTSDHHLVKETLMRNRAGAIALMAAPIIGLAATLSLPNLDGNGALRLAVIEAESTRFLAGNLLLLTSFAVFVLAVLSLRAPLLARGSRWGAWAVVATGAGWTLHLAIVGMVMTQLPMAFAADRAVAAGLSDSLFESDGFTAVLLPMLVLTELGTILAAIALWRAKLAPVWASAVIVAALISEFIVPAPFDGVALYALLTIGFGGIGWRMLRRVETDRTAQHASAASVDA
jgi:hypothetical protein